MDMKRVRLALAAERERRGLNQQDVAMRAGLKQGHLSNIENVDAVAMKDLSARVVFQIIEKGLGLSVVSFFAALDASDQKDTGSKQTALTTHRQATNNAPSSLSLGGVDGDTHAGIFSADRLGAAVNTPASDIIIGSALIDAGTFLIRRGEEARGSGTTVENPPPAKPRPRLRGARNR